MVTKHYNWEFGIPRVDQDFLAVRVIMFWKWVHVQ